MAGTVVGQPPRKRLRIDDDPFGAIGDYAGSFLDQVRARTARRLRHQPAPHRAAEGIGVLCGGAGIPRGLRVAAPRRRRRSARLVHRLRQHLSAADRRHHLLGTGRGRPAGFHRPCRRPARRQPRLPPARPGPAARRHRQSRQPEHPGRPAALSDLYDARRHASASTRISTACSCPPAPPSTAPSIRRQNSPTAPRPATTTATTTSSAASGVSATI